MSACAFLFSPLKVAISPFRPGRRLCERPPILQPGRWVSTGTGVVRGLDRVLPVLVQELVVFPIVLCSHLRVCTSTKLSTSYLLVHGSQLFSVACRRILARTQRQQRRRRWQRLRAGGCGAVAATARQRQAAMRAEHAEHEMQRVQRATSSHSRSSTQRGVEKRRRVIIDSKPLGGGTLTSPE